MCNLHTSDAYQGARCGGQIDYTDIQTLCLSRFSFSLAGIMFRDIKVTFSIDCQHSTPNTSPNLKTYTEISFITRPCYLNLAYSNNQTKTVIHHSLYNIGPTPRATTEALLTTLYYRICPCINKRGRHSLNHTLTPAKHYSYNRSRHC